MSYGFNEDKSKYDISGIVDDVASLIADKPFDYIVDNDSNSDGWRWIKYNSGACELWGRFNVTFVNGNQFVKTLNLPFNLADNDYLGIAQCANYHVSQCYVSDKTISQCKIGMTANTSENAIVDVIIKGRWK